MPAGLHACSRLALGCCSGAAVGCSSRSRCRHHFPPGAWWQILAQDHPASTHPELLQLGRTAAEAGDQLTQRNLPPAAP